MSAVWYSLVIYIIGISVVLFVRPAFMFHPNGTWKEFGLSNTANHTMMPFWMFVLVWAILSFAGANLIQIFLASTVLQSMGPAIREPLLQPISATPVSTPMPAPMPAPVPVPTTISSLQSNANKVPGYYVLDRVLNPEPRYVYWGPEPPTSADLGSRTTA
jgi:hypothetical protein